MHILVAVLAILQASGAAADALAVSAQVQSLDGFTTPYLVDYGRQLVTRGQNLNRAIAAFDIVCKREPRNREFQLALGCSCASRYASLAVARRQARRYASDRAAYEQRRTAWQKAQNTPSDPLFGRQAPVPPSEPVTLDDGRPYRLTELEGMREMVRLGRKACGAFNAAGDLATDRPARDRADASYTRGWGLYLLRRFGDGIVSEPRSLSQPSSRSPRSGSADKVLEVGEQDVLQCFDVCTHADPGNADYWESLALARVPKYARFDDQYLDYINGSPVYSAERVNAAVADLKEALERRPADFHVLYLLALVLAPSDANRSAGYLEVAARHGASNAVVWYQVAERKFRLADNTAGTETTAIDDDAIVAVEAGNRASVYAAVPLSLPVPPLLRRAWESGALYGIEDPYVIMAVYEALHAIIHEQGTAYDERRAARAAYAEFGLGLKIMQAMDGNDVDVRLPRSATIRDIRRALGPAYCVDGYNAIRDMNRRRPDELKEQFLARNASLVERVRNGDASMRAGR